MLVAGLVITVLNNTLTVGTDIKNGIAEASSHKPLPPPPRETNLHAMPVPRATALQTG